MNQPTATTEALCAHRSEIAAYIDGELIPREELELEMHLAVCKSCNAELNEQKTLLRALDYALENGHEIELPANFTRVVVTAAESKVSGLRRPQERSKALFVCAALFLLVLFGLGGDTETIFSAFGKFTEQILAVGGFVSHIIYDIAIGTTVILRSLGNQFIFSSSLAFGFLIVFFCLSLIALSRLIIRYNRT